MFIVSIISLTLSLLFVGTSAQTTNGNVKHDDEGVNRKTPLFAPGDPRPCLEIARKSDFPLKRFSALPGIGWDNLLNVATGQVISFNFTKCKMTEDGRYLIPDAIFTIPVKTSIVETFAEIYTSWNDATSITSRSINVDTGLRFGFRSISGSYSQEHTRLKRKQIQDDTATTRVQLRYLRYKAKLQPGSPLHPAFRSRVLSIASDLYQNMTQSAYYKAQLLVREYGTHIQSSVTAGAGLVKTDFLSRSYFASTDNDKRVITASASASFGEIFKFDASFKQITDVTIDNGYKQSMTHSYITTFGGPLYRPYNMTVSQWVDGVDSEMVPMDRSGDPLYFVINADMFPGLPVRLIDLLQENIKEAIQQYYEMNTVRGCTRRGSPNFSFSANVDDGSCVESKMNLTLGGVFQICAVSGTFLSSNPCTDMTQVNPLTQGYTCPTGYKSIQLHSGTKLGQQESSKKCKRCGFLWLKKCCHNNYVQAKAHYTTYWCAANGPVSQNSGYLFGGIWSSSSMNLVTKAKGCPPMFYSLKIFQEHRICLSGDYELGEPYAMPFGGFISCITGNPLAVTSDENPSRTLTAYLEDSTHWPMKCPPGFSQHLAAIDDGCEIRYCIRTGALSGLYGRPVRRPPFSSKPESIRRTDVFTIINSDNSIQTSGMIVSENEYEKVLALEKSTDPTEPDSSNQVTPLSLLLITAITILINLAWTFA